MRPKSSAHQQFRGAYSGCGMWGNPLLEQEPCQCVLQIGVGVFNAALNVKRAYKRGVAMSEAMTYASN